MSEIVREFEVIKPVKQQKTLIYSNNRV